MFRVSYIKITAKGAEVVTISHPSLRAAKDVYDALKIAGVHVRLWDKESRLIVPVAKKQLLSIGVNT